MTERRDVVVIGGGVVGVCAAHALVRRGAAVTLLERGEICSGASYGNAGWLFPSHSSPLPVPGVVRKGARWLVDRDSPLYIRPRLDARLARWLWDFWRASGRGGVRRCFELRRDLSLRSLALYEKLAASGDLEFGFTQRGLLLACAGSAALEEATEELELLRDLGGEGRVVSGEELLELSPELSRELPGGVYYPADAYVQPADFVCGLARAAASAGVDVREHTEVTSLERAGGRVVAVHATRGDFRCDEVVLAAGAWSPELARAAGVRLPIEAAKGYSLTYRRPEGFGDVAVMLAEAKVGVTPMGDTLRFAGTLELAGLDLSISERRVEAIRRAALRWFPQLPALERIETWRGLRPCTPDDLPVIGRAPATPNLVLATGHGMSGIAQGPITGELVAQLISGEPTEIDLAPFTPARF